ncbi:O-antigen ligase family protein [Pedobacter duraquae]|uniref:O-antigen ligase-related domain-containing protein n=1 Tax=Pedobacter duraquae TaxID=425511 RepID=A0A4R6IEP5_9SPHI|nr:O-antigen ligase family protein [Pedobacter duraquae]TDO20171.1 hypothetical protein CLV32_3931 [Pedobacter duraquae]
MIIFPLIYFTVFVYALKQLFNRNKEGIMIFLIFGLPIYITSLSTAFNTGFKSLVPFMLPFKEVLVLITIGTCVWDLKKRMKVLTVDYLVLSYFFVTLLYVFLPIGTNSFFDKAIAFKSSSFFTFIYLAGRVFNPREISINKAFNYILIVIILAAGVLFFELMTDQQLQTLTGYADYNFYYYNQDPEGNYGLSWTFETSTGIKRFASFFANPLEFGAATLVALAVIAGLYTTSENKLKVNTLGIIAIITTQFTILLAVSRASLASYLIMIYIYAWVTKNRRLLNFIHFSIIAGIIYFIFFLFVVHPDLYEFIYETITFTNPSSIGHIVAWLEGIDAIIKNPFGLGLGESGRVGMSNNSTTGGENQFIILGVQAGILTAFLYASILISLIRMSLKWYPKLKGKERKVCLTLLLMKVGFIIPLLTAEFESYSYISYLSWFLSGLLVQMISEKQTSKSIIDVNAQLQQSQALNQRHE